MTLPELKNKILEELNDDLNKFDGYLTILEMKDKISQAIDETANETYKAIKPGLDNCEIHEGEPYLIGCNNCDLAKAFNLAINKMKSNFDKFKKGNE